METKKHKFMVSKIAGILFIVLGIMLAAGGGWLIMLGGAFFYLIAGIVLAATGFLLVQQRYAAFWLGLILLTAALIWSLYEVGLDFWQSVPRLITFLIVAFTVTVLAPSLSEKKGAQPKGKTGLTTCLSLILAVVLIAFFVGMFKVHPTVRAASSAQPPVIHADAGMSDGNDWHQYGRNTSGTRFAQFDQIHKDNVKKLKVAWQFRTGDIAKDGAEFQGTPIKVKDTVYICTPFNKVFALDADTGTEKWRFDPHASAPEWQRCRGVAYAETASDSGVCASRIVMTTIDARLTTIDAVTGKVCQDFGRAGFVDLRQHLGPRASSYKVTSAPLVAGDVVVVGGQVNDNNSINEPSGVVRAYDVSTGVLRWSWDPLNPKRMSALSADEIYTPESPNFWGTASYDPALGLVYIPTGNQTPDFWGGDRHPGSDEYNDAIVAIDVKTGVDKWHFRTVNHDLWDYDVTAQPILYDLPDAQGNITPVVIALTKRGQIFVLDRRNGQPVFPVELRKVPTDGVPEDQIVADEQPYSAISVGAERLTESDMWGMSVFDQLYCRIQFKRMRWEGEFTPVGTEKRSLIYPGYYGGFNWGGGALDAVSGTLIVNDIRMAQWAHFIKQDEARRIGLTPSAEGEYSEQTGTPYGVERAMFVSPLGIPCFKPPFGSLTAIDLTSGKTKWQVPLGSIEDTPVRGITPHVHIPLGMPTMGGPLVTKGGLTFFIGTMDFYIRAIDNDTGKEIWRDRLPVAGQAAPMTYMSDATGKQYIVFTAGGATRTGTNEHRGDYVIAYTLSDD